MIFKKTIEIVKEVPHDANKKKWLDNGWTEVVKKPKTVKVKKTVKKKTKKK